MGDQLNNPQFNVDAVTGQIKDQNLVDADSLQIDMTGAATGINADGTVNQTGQALTIMQSKNSAILSIPQLCLVSF